MNSDEILAKLKKQLKLDIKYCRRKELKSARDEDWIGAKKQVIWMLANKALLQQIKELETSQSRASRKEVSKE